MESIIIYDGICNLCTGAVLFISRNDKKKQFRYVPLQSEEGEKLLLKSEVSGNGLSSVIYISSGQIYTRSSAVLHILRVMGGRWKIFFVFILVPPFIRNLIYILIAKLRYRIFGKREACLLRID